MSFDIMVYFMLISLRRALYFEIALLTLFMKNDSIFICIIKS